MISFQLGMFAICILSILYTVLRKEPIFSLYPNFDTMGGQKMGHVSKLAFEVV